jgi:ribokinase
MRSVDSIRFDEIEAAGETCILDDVAMMGVRRHRRRPSGGQERRRNGTIAQQLAEMGRLAVEAAVAVANVRAETAHGSEAHQPTTSTGPFRVSGGGPPGFKPEIAVVGSLNLDLVVRVPHHPAPGETVLGGDSVRNPGGKGANQAVAAARLGRRVAMVGRVGDDEPGRVLLASLDREGVDRSRVAVSEGAPTGIALIAVDEQGENSIVVSPGANARVNADDVAATKDALGRAAVTLLQLEVPVEAVAAAARASSGTVILNPAPAGELPKEMIRAVDVLVPNRIELAMLCSSAVPESVEETIDLARRIEGPGAVVVTLGDQGALMVKGETWAHIPTVKVDPVDTTAAGDAFCGALADAMVRGESLEGAVRWAVRAAALTCTRLGAQISLPSRVEVEALLA